VKRARWPAIERELRALPPPGQPRPAAEFWREFRVRAAAPADAAVPPGLEFPRWLAAAAALLLVASLLWLFVAGRQPAAGGTPVVGQQTAAILPVRNEIKSVTVFARSTGAVILDDAPDDGIILWVAGAEEEN
jgi:hypothetical protein